MAHNQVFGFCENLCSVEVSPKTDMPTRMIGYSNYATTYFPTAKTFFNCGGFNFNELNFDDVSFNGVIYQHAVVSMTWVRLPKNIQTIYNIIVTVTDTNANVDTSNLYMIRNVKLSKNIEKSTDEYDDYDLNFDIVTPSRVGYGVTGLRVDWMICGYNA